MSKVLHKIAETTDAAITSGAPYSADLRRQFVASTNVDVLKWVKNDGSLSGNLLDAISAVTDSNNIDLTLTGNNLTASVIIDPAADNILKTSGTGLYVKDLSIASGSSSFLSYNSTTRELSVSQLLVTDVTVAVQSTIAAFVTANYTGTQFQEGDFIVLSDGTTYIHNGGVAGTVADFTLVNSGAAITGLTLSGDSGTSQAITNGNTILVSGGIALSSVVGATDKVTLNIDFAKQAALGAAPDSADTFLIYDASAAGYRTATYANLLAGHSITVAGASGTNQTLTNGETLTITGSHGITTVGSATDTITVRPSTLPTTGGTTVQAWTFDDNTDTYAWTNITGLGANFFSADLTQTAARAHTQAANAVTINGTGTWTWGAATAGPSRVNVAVGDLEIQTATNGLILKSPGGTRYRLTVDNGGILSVATA
jgi:hypothetical protein